MKVRAGTSGVLQEVSVQVGQQVTPGFNIVLLTGPLPASAHFDLSVDGTIELERLSNVLYMGRPAFGQGQQTVGLFRLSADGLEAPRISVTLGRSSVSTIEIIDGLREGDQVILSDTSAMDSYNRIRVR